MELETIVTAKSVHLTDAHKNPPPNGSAVLALTLGGKLVETIWKVDSLKYYDAWSEYPKVPKSVKKRQLARFNKEGS